MSTVTSRSVGGYVASEPSTSCVGRLYKPNASRRPVLYFTGSNGNDRDFLDTAASGSQLAPRLADLGAPLISASFGTPGSALLWGNDTAQTRVGQLWTYVKTALGTRTDQFVGIGVSKGATAMLNYARNNPANVAALLLIVPAVNVSDIHDNDRSGNAASIEAAYGGAAGWTAAAAAHDPALNTATHASQAIPMKLLYGDSDTTVLPSTVTTFAAAVGPSAQAVLVGSGLGHLTVGPAADPLADVWSFLSSYV